MIEFFYVYILGVLSILSACTIIVIPVLLSQVLTKKRKLYTAAVFCLGFSSSFAALGVITGLLGSSILPRYESYLLLFGALLTFVMALRFFGVFYSNMISVSLPYRGSNTFVLGVVFGFVGISCISPLLAPVLVLAISKASIIPSALVFLVYSLGYSTPLVAASTILEEEQILSFMKKHRSRIDFTSGLLLLFASFYLTLLYLGMAPVI